MAAACTPALLCNVDMFTLAAVTLALILPNQVTIVDEKPTLFPNADPISSRVSRASDAPFVRVLNLLSTYVFSAVLATVMAALAAINELVWESITALAAVTLALVLASVAMTALAAVTLALMPVMILLVGK